MTWVTKRRIKVNRAATAWLIRRFIDRDATLLFVEPEDGANARGYLDAFFQNIQWDEVNRRAEQAKAR